MNIIIDTCCLFNSANLFENKINFDKFQGDRYQGKLLDIEQYCLKAIISLTHLINFDNKEIVDFIFNLIFKKLYQFKKFKDSIPIKTFSPHIILIKCYSLFLNRFCFYYSSKNGCDLADSFNHFLEQYPEAKFANQFVFKELIGYFSFIISNRYSFFKFFGENMIFYFFNYFDTLFLSIKCDIILFKYLLIQPEIQEKFNIKNIILLSDISLINGFFFELINDNIIINKIEFNNDYQRNCVKYSNSIIEFLYLIIRDNLSMENIAFRHLDFKFKMRDEEYEKLYLNEKEKIDLLVKNEIIHFILGKKKFSK